MNPRHAAELAIVILIALTIAPGSSLAATEKSKFSTLSFVKTSDPNVLMMQSTKDRNRHDAADSLRAPRFRCVFVQ